MPANHPPLSYSPECGICRSPSGRAHLSTCIIRSLAQSELHFPTSTAHSHKEKTYWMHLYAIAGSQNAGSPGDCLNITTLVFSVASRKPIPNTSTSLLVSLFGSSLNGLVERACPPAPFGPSLPAVLSIFIAPCLMLLIWSRAPVPVV